VRDAYLQRRRSLIYDGDEPQRPDDGAGPDGGKDGKDGNPPAAPTKPPAADDAAKKPEPAPPSR
jgi:phospholipid-binding lipoprotein MlaA